MKLKTSVLLLIGSVLLAASCKDDDAAACATAATVKNYAGLDGCGYVFRLDDGKILEPYMPFTHLQEDSPLSGFQFVDGKKVMINYELVEDAASVCMAGQVVKITCITDLGISEESK